MRMIGHLEGEAKARAFGDYLLVEGIENDIEPDKGGAFAVWVHAEEEVERAAGMLADYRENPADPRFLSADRAAQVKEQKRKEQADYEKRLKGRRHLFRPLTGYGFGPVTFVLIFVSVLVFALYKPYDDKSEAYYPLLISQKDINEDLQRTTSEGVVNRLKLVREILPEVREGNVWRLVTPIFVHFSFIHIICNMLWLVDLGSMIEGRQKSWLLAVMVLALAVVSNLAQYLWHGPSFGGMSGVVYGLLGYVWIRGKLDPGSGLFLHSSTVTMMIVWFFICFTGAVGPIGNAAHAAGLVMGMAWGALSSLRHR